MCAGARVILVVLQSVLLLAGWSSGVSFAEDEDPTAIVIDAETGKPIEGAVAIAIWRGRTYEDRWFEGGRSVVKRVEEAVSDSKGRIEIHGFWDGWYPFKDKRDRELPVLRRNPHLTVYKFGYVCWDQYLVFKSSKEREDFTNSNRIARMNKLPKEVSLDGHEDFSTFSFVDHESFIGAATGGDYPKAKQNLFQKAIEIETPYCIREGTMLDKKRKQEERDRRRRQQ